MWPVGARAQQAGMTRLGILNFGNPEPLGIMLRTGLRDIGYEEGRNTKFESGQEIRCFGRRCLNVITSGYRKSNLGDDTCRIDTVGGQCSTALCHDRGSDR